MMRTQAARAPSPAERRPTGGPGTGPATVNGAAGDGLAPRGKDREVFSSSNYNWW